jgi:hypothetical protein
VDAVGVERQLLEDRDRRRAVGDTDDQHAHAPTTRSITAVSI